MNAIAPESQQPVLVAIDGPAGSGKSSVSRAVADRLGFGILDTGAAYRALAWAALERDLDLDDPVALEEVLDDWAYSTSLRGAPVILVGDTDVTDEIRDPGVSAQVSRVARHTAIRTRLNHMFRSIARESALPGVVIEGRDITTVVAPDAPVRIILTASPAARAARRAGELRGFTAERVQRDIEARDAQDAKVVDFFHPAPGVTLIDTSELDFEASVRAVIDTIDAAGTARRPADAAHQDETG